MSLAARLVAVLSFMIATACSSGNTERMAGSSASPPPPDANVTEQARLKLVDKCMLDGAITAPPRDKKGKAPRCQCYAKVVADKLSPSEQTYYLSTGGLPMSVRTDEVMATCNRV
jgi:hypothetical protein